jgi:hypothetical protein
MKGLAWAAHRIGHLVLTGVGVASTVATVVIVLLPFASGLPSWLAAIPIPAYMIGQLLKDEYDRTRSACLTASVLWEKDGSRKNSWLEIRNCGPVPIEQVDWDDPPDSTHWQIISDDIQRPWPVLDPDQKLRLYLSLVLIADSQVTLHLRGVVNGRPYHRDKLVSRVG